MPDGADASEDRPRLVVEVEWPGGHIVQMDVVIEPALTYMREDEVVTSSVLTGVARYDFDRDVLRDDDSFVDALRRWTVAAQNDEVVTAQCVEPRLPDLLARLKATPPISGPIRFTLPREKPPANG